MTNSAFTGLAALATASSAAFLAWAVRGRASSVFGPSVHHGPPAARPSRSHSTTVPASPRPAYWNCSTRYQTPATFFQIGANVERLPQIARAVHSSGHEIGNHSHTHPLFCFHSVEFIYQEFARAQRAIEDVTGFSPTLLRAPFGARWFGFRAAQRRLGLRGVMWTAIGYDWKAKADTIVDRMLAGAANGSILCLHDGRTVRANPISGKRSRPSAA
jgi:peptidoglycan-N-acetylglucosamine deacetylase